MSVAVRQLRVASLRGNFHEGNFGDDALLLACTALLLCRAKSLCVDGKVAYQDERLAGLDAAATTDVLPDLIVYGGGTQFFSFGTPDNMTQRSSRALSLARKIFLPSAYAASFRARARGVHLRRIPKIAIGVGVGPFSDSVSAEATASLLRDMALVWVRDVRSENFCRSHGVKNLVASADLCFTDAFSRVTLPIISLPRPERQAQRVAIILRDWKPLGVDFFRRQIDVARRLRAAGHFVRFIGLSMHDHRYLSEMAAAGEEVLVWDPHKARLEDFWNTLSFQDLIVTSRFHGAIFAILSGTPYVAIEIEPKLVNLREIVPELAEFAVDPSADAGLISKSVAAALAQSDQLLPALRRALSTQRDLARRGEDALKAFFESRMCR